MASEYIDYQHSLPLDNELKYFIDHLDGSPIDKYQWRKWFKVIQILEAATSSLLNVR